MIIKISSQYVYSDSNTKRFGFTIVELLIVIVVIGILAAISIVSFTGIQQRARDNQRLQAVSDIRKALELYKADNGRYPSSVPNVNYASWEVSVDSTFMRSLQEYMPSSPKDPINSPEHYFAYSPSVAGNHGCPEIYGGFYVLRVVGLEQVDGRSVSDLGPCKSSTSLSQSRTPSANQAVFMGFEN